MGVDWQLPDAHTRLLSAVIEACDVKLNYKAITKLYGREATVSSIEHHLRSFRSEGKELKVEAEKAAAEAEAALAAAAENGGDVGESSCANYLVDTSHALGKTAPKVTKTGTAKAKNGVQDGRVTKKRATVKKPLANTATKKSKMDVAAKTDVDNEEPKVKAEAVETEDGGLEEEDVDGEPMEE